MARNIVMFDRFTYDDFGDAVGVDVGRVPGVETAVVGGFEEGRAFSSSTIQLLIH